MTILFAGGELEDFTLSGIVTASTTSTSLRSTYARMAVLVAPAAFNSTYAKASFTASSAFSVTARVNILTSNSASNIILWLATGGSARLRLKLSSTAPTTLVLESYTSGGSATTLATSVLTVSVSTVYRLDLIVDYQVSGRVRLYVDGTLFIDYSGDVTASSATTLDGLYLAQAHSATQSTAWSEVIVSTQDSRTLSLKTLTPDAAGTTSSWTGAYTDIDETTASDVDVLTSATANQVTSVNTTGMPSGWSNLTVTAVKCVASAARGSTGPSKLALGVRTNSTDSFPTATTLDTGFSTPVTTYYELNPVTGVAWTTAELDALQLAFRSET
jgi:hypothetical protein